ncbi:unannotated protein [freshwater metagenome]|uniref:Unannotated protein n=1 Tax=freshwater metagenome TaxID=449393 RepID=A0A6J7NDD7_9ZZZZ
MRIKRIFVDKEVVLLKSVSNLLLVQRGAHLRDPTLDMDVVGVEGPATGG